MELLDKIGRFFLNSKESISKKAAIAIIILATVLLVDYTTGFSYNLWANNKLSQLQKIEELKQKYPENKYLMLELNIMEERILFRDRNMYDYLSSTFFSEPRRDLFISLRDSTRSAKSFIIDSASLNMWYVDPITKKASKIPSTIAVADVISEKKPSIIFDFWHIVTSSYPYIIVLLMIPFIPIYVGSFSLEMFAGMIIGTITNIFFVWFFSYIFNLIPILWRVEVNYVVNVILQSLVIYISLILDKKFEERRVMMYGKNKSNIKESATESATE